MTTFKGMILPHHKKEDGTIPAKIRITHNRQSKFISTSIVFFPDQYSKTFKMKNTSPKDKLEKLERHYTELIASITTTIKRMSIEEVIRYVTADRDESRINFIKFYEDEIKNVKNKGSAGLYQTSLNNLVKYTKGTLYADEIDYNFLVKYAEWIEKMTSGRAVSLYIGNLRAMFNRAKKVYNDDDIGLIRITRSPFSKYKIPSQPETRKRALEVAQLIAIRDLPDGGIRWNLARDVFMLSFYFMGMNSADLYVSPKLKSARMEYERKKTKGRRKDNAFISIEIQPEAVKLIDKYKGIDNQFRFNKLYGNTRDFNKAINLGLKQIGDELKIEDLEFYAARHSWATIAQNQCGVDKFTVHECLNHMSQDMKITDIYIKKDWTHLDNANRAVLDKLIQKEIPII